MRILVAEDDPVSAHLLRRKLKQWGFDVLLVTDGKQAIDELSKPDGPRLAVLDWMMPSLDGVSVCRMCRNYQFDVPPYLILLTAQRGTTHTIEALQAGADD